MDTLTHALSGVLLARVVVPHLPQGAVPALRRTLIVGGLSAAFPDGDVVISLVSDQLTYLNLHRGVTHSLILLPLWALLLATLFTLLDRKRCNWRSYFIVAMASITIHIIGDVITTYGTQILAPFSTWKASLPFTFIIDLWFSGIIVTGLLASWWWRTSPRPAQLALVILACYVTFQALLSARATAVGEQFVQQQGLPNAQVAVLPQPLSPFNWKIIVSTADDYQIAYVNLWRHAAPPEPASGSNLIVRIDALYQPAQSLSWQRQARFGDVTEQQMLSQEVWRAPVMAGVRRFIEYPVLAKLDQRNKEGTCVWFDDLRFTLSDVRSPFRFGACRSNRQSDWRLFRLINDNLIPL